MDSILKHCEKVFGILSKTQMIKCKCGVVNLIKYKAGEEWSQEMIKLKENFDFIKSECKEALLNGNNSAQINDNDSYYQPELELNSSRSTDHIYSLLSDSVEEKHKQCLTTIEKVPIEPSIPQATSSLPSTLQAKSANLLILPQILKSPDLGEDNVVLSAKQSFLLVPVNPSILLQNSNNIVKDTVPQNTKPKLNSSPKKVEPNNTSRKLKPLGPFEDKPQRRLSKNYMKCQYENCQFEAWEQRVMVKHKFYVHDQKVCYLEACDFIATDPLALERHQRSHKRVFKCKLCDFTANDLKQYNKHSLNHPKEKQIVICKYSTCNYQTQFPYRMVQHVAARHNSMFIN